MSIRKVWKISPGSNAFFWGECRVGNFIALGWSVLGDISHMSDIDELKNKYIKRGDSPGSAGQCCPQIWSFWNEIQIGDIVLANDGKLEIRGIGKVNSTCYLDENKIPLPAKKDYNRLPKKEFAYIRDIDWDPSFPQDGIKIPEQGDWTKTVMKLEGGKLEKIFGYLKEGEYDIDGFLSHVPKSKGPVPEFPDPKTVKPIYIGTKIKPPPPSQKGKSPGGKPKKKKQGKVESMSDEQKKAIGKQGELVVYEGEKRRLTKAERPDLAKNVERISSNNDYAGYDILSFRKDGSEKYIEVKSTKVPSNEKNTKFEITANEVNASKTYGNNYYIYRVFDVTSTRPEIKVIKNPYGRITLEPKVYTATVYFEQAG